MVNQIHSRIYDLIGENLLDEALNLLSEVLKKNCDLYKDLILIKRQHTASAKNKINGTENGNNLTISHNKIAREILELTKEIDARHLNKNFLKCSEIDTHGSDDKILKKIRITFTHSIDIYL